MQRPVEIELHLAKLLTASRLTADAKPFWSALYHSLTLTDTEDYEYRRSSIYENIDSMYRIKNQSQIIESKPAQTAKNSLVINRNDFTDFSVAVSEQSGTGFLDHEWP
jgi:hypothetical protein